ncbi:hypothetical protein DFH09DRAFT_1308960 [Mycena vulgaris]|nr:hypothetical protein DFH09DRAFT_1308960 [Mycena vulgaris]
MDYNVFSDNACPTDTGSFFDANTNHLQWNRSTSNTPASLVPDASFTFGFETGLTNELPFSAGVSHASCDLGSLFMQESDSANWNPSWSGENSWELGNEYTSLPSSSDCVAIFPPELEAVLATADPSLALGSVSAAADLPPLHLCGSDDLPVSSSGSPTVDLTQYEMSNSEAQNFLGWEWQKSSTRWLDEGVSSEVCHFPQAIKVSHRTKFSHVERVTGLPSQFPVPPEATAFLINVTHIPNLDPDTTVNVDAPLKDQDIHSWGGSTSGRSGVKARRRNKNYILVCSHRDTIQCPTGHRTLEIPDYIDEELFLKAVNGEKIVEDEDQENECCKVYSSRQGKKGKNVCSFKHIKERLPFEAKHPELARMCIVIPNHKPPHRHPVPPPLKVPHAAAEKYKKCVRKLGLGATVTKVEKALSTKEILGVLNPSLYNPGLVSRDTKTKLINAVKSEPGHQTRRENQSTFTFLFHEPEVTLGRVWMKLHDRRSFQFVWEELLSLVKRLTDQRFGFVALHRGGTLLGINADMEAAPLLGMADALLPTIDIPCYSHVKRGIPDVSHLPRENQDCIHNFMYMENPEDVEETKIWIRTLPDPNGWWEHKEMYEWLLPSVIQCLSDIDPDFWHVMEVTTNCGEAQHAANNAQTGIGMGLVESYEILDTRRAAEIEIMLQSGNLHSPRNEVSHRDSSRNARRVNATEKAKHARAADEEVQAAEQAVADAQAQLKQIRTESKVWCFLTLFRLLTTYRPIIPSVFVPPESGRVSLPNPMITALPRILIAN